MLKRLFMGAMVLLLGLSPVLGDTESPTPAPEAIKLSFGPCRLGMSLEEFQALTTMGFRIQKSPDVGMSDMFQTWTVAQIGKIEIPGFGVMRNVSFTFTNTGGKWVLTGVSGMRPFNLPNPANSSSYFNMLETSMSKYYGTPKRTSMGTVWTTKEYSLRLTDSPPISFEYEVNLSIQRVKPDDSKKEMP